MGQNRSLKRNLKIHWTEWKGKYNISKFMGVSQGSAEREIYNTKFWPINLIKKNNGIRKKGKFSNLSLNLKKLKKLELNKFRIVAQGK